MRIPHGYVPTTSLGPPPHGEPASDDHLGSPLEQQMVEVCDQNHKEERAIALLHEAVRLMSERLQLRIESDGTARGTRVVDVETGRLLPVQAVTWSMDIRAQTSNAVATATIVVPLVEVVLDASARVDGVLHLRYPPVPASASADHKTP